MIAASRWLLWAALLLGVASTAGPVTWYTLMRMVQFDLHHPRNLLLSEQAKLQLSNLGQVQMLNLDRWSGLGDIRILTLRQAEFAFYSRVRYISHIDPRMVPFFQAKTVEAAFTELRRLGITHVSIPEEPLPTLYNSFLEEIVNSGRFVRRRNHFGAAILCELFEEPQARAELGESMLIPAEDWTPWSFEEKYAVDESRFRKAEGASTITNQPMISANAKEMRLSSGEGPIDVIPELAGTRNLPRLQFGREYQLETDLRGHGLVLIEVHLYVDDSPHRIVPVWQGYLSGRVRPLRATFAQDLISTKCVDCGTASARVAVRLLSRGEVRVGRTVIRESGFAASSSSIERAAAEKDGWALVTERPDIVRWGMVQTPEKMLFLQQVGGYPTSVESAAFPAAEGTRSLALSMNVRGSGRYFAELRCAQDERYSGEEISPDTAWLADALSPSGSAMDLATEVAAGAVQSVAAGWARGDWTLFSVPLQVPDCGPLAGGALIRRLFPGRNQENAGSMLRLALTTRREADYRGRTEEFPHIELRDIVLNLPSAQELPLSDDVFQFSRVPLMQPTTEPR